MAISGDMLTLLDQAKRTDPDGNTAMIVELLSEQSSMIKDAVSIEGNGPTHHRTTVRTGLPAAEWRRLNYGVGRSKSRTAQVDDGYGMLEIYAETDKSIVDLAMDKAAFRFSEEGPFRSSMLIEMEDTLLNGNTDTDPEKFLGITPRYNDYTAANADNIIPMELTANADSTSQSIWFITWGPQTSFLSFPKGGKAGLTVTDKGQETLNDGASGQFEGYRTHYKWDIGFVLRDWRYSVRVPNIMTSRLLAGTTTAQAFFDKLIDAYYQIEDFNHGNTIMYASKEIQAWMHKLALNTTSVAGPLVTRQVMNGPEDFAGKPVVDFLGIPVHRSDSIVAESPITGVT